MQNKTDFVRTAALQLYAALDWQGTAVQAVSCAEGLYDALRQKGYGFAETNQPESLTCTTCRGEGVCTVVPTPLTAQPVTTPAQSKHHRGGPDG